MPIKLSSVTGHLLLLAAIMVLPGLAAAQYVSAVSIEGEVYVKYSKNGKEQYTRMVYGPLNMAEKIIVKEAGSVRLVNDKNMVCTLAKAGDYKVSELSFTSAKNTPMFASFCKYFKSFFTNHDNSESKSNYKNTIFAISRGQAGTLSPDFPVSGILPYGRLGGLPFSWTHDCEKCTYRVRIFDLESKLEVFNRETDRQSLMLEASDNVLKPARKYYWTVEFEGAVSDKVYFEMSRNADFEEKISGLKNQAEEVGNELSATAKNIFILSNLEESGLTNYAILYGQYLRDMYPENAILQNVVDRLWYDHLLER